MSSKQRQRNRGTTSKRTKKAMSSLEKRINQQKKTRSQKRERGIRSKRRFAPMQVNEQKTPVPLDPASQNQLNISPLEWQNIKQFVNDFIFKSMKRGFSQSQIADAIGHQLGNRYPSLQDNTQALQSVINWALEPETQEYVNQHYNQQNARLNAALNANSEQKNPNYPLFNSETSKLIYQQQEPTYQDWMNMMNKYPDQCPHALKRIWQNEQAAASGQPMRLPDLAEMQACAQWRRQNNIPDPTDEMAAVLLARMARRGEKYHSILDSNNPIYHQHKNYTGQGGKRKRKRRKKTKRRRRKSRRKSRRKRR